MNSSKQTRGQISAAEIEPGEGALHLVGARLARAAEERRAAALRAQVSLSEALRLDWWLTREYEPALREAHRMLAER